MLTTNFESTIVAINEGFLTPVEALRLYHEQIADEQEPVTRQEVMNAEFDEDFAEMMRVAP